MVLNAHAGTKYGIPFPVYCRRVVRDSRGERAGAAAGIRGLRLVRHPNLDRRLGNLQNPDRLESRVGSIWPFFLWSVSNIAQLICFLFFWAINMLVIYKGIESIRLLLNIKAPLLIALGLALLAWAYYAANGFGPMLSQTVRFCARRDKSRTVLVLLFYLAHR